MPFRNINTRMTTLPIQEEVQVYQQWIHNQLIVKNEASVENVLMQKSAFSQKVDYVQCSSLSMQVTHM